MSLAHCKRSPSGTQYRDEVRRNYEHSANCRISQGQFSWLKMTLCVLKDFVRKALTCGLSRCVPSGAIGKSNTARSRLRFGLVNP